MSLLKNKKFQILAVILSVATLILIAAFIYGYKTHDNSHNLSLENGAESFTFFELGEHTKFSKDVRQNLEDKLGSDAISNWNTINLAINYKGFLRDYFPELYELNKKLNSPAGERVEHDTIQLTYRHARKKNAPFEYVKLIFSNYSKKPLLFYIKSKKEGSDIIEAIANKFGQAKTIRWDNEEGLSLYWEKNRSILIISISNDRFGNPEYYTTIYYVPNLEKLVIREQNKIKQKEEQIKQRGKTAF